MKKEKEEKRKKKNQEKRLEIYNKGTNRGFSLGKLSMDDKNRSVKSNR